MALSGIFSQNSIQNLQNTQSVNHNTATGTSGGDNLRNLSAGDTLQAQVVERNGNEVTLKLEDNSTITAKLSQAMNLEPGKSITFEVRGNGQGLTLSPLFTNTATDANVLKALNMASLPVSDSSVQMTQYMMQSGLSVDKNSLQQMMASLNANPGANVQDAVDLTRLGMPVNEENLQQMSAYKNLSYQIDSGMQEIAENVNNTLMDLISQGDGKDAGTVLSGLIDAATAFPVPLEGEGGSPVGTAATPEGQAATVSAGEGQNTVAAGTSGEQLNVNLTEGTMMESSLVRPEGGSPEEGIAMTARQATSGEGSALEMATPQAQQAPSEAAAKALELLFGKEAVEQLQPGKEQQNTGMGTTAGTEAQANVNTDPVSVTGFAGQNLTELSGQLAEELTALTGDGKYQNLTGQELLHAGGDLLKQALNAGDTKTVKELLQNTSLKELTFGALKSQWSISPEEVAEKQKVEDLYKRLSTQLQNIQNALESAGQSSSQAYSSASNMGNNLDFLQQINQMYAYVQLPLRLTQGDASHGDLYVYSNGKKLTGNESSVSALLHLDMKHLGPLDCYVAMDRSGVQQKVTTQFYVQDDSILDFLNAHMDELTKRIEGRGYSCSCKMWVRGEEPEEQAQALSAGGVNLLLMQAGSMHGSSNTSFDVRT